jgi:endonuclease YncB( thermonuclease family)
MRLAPVLVLACGFGLGLLTAQGLSRPVAEAAQAPGSPGREPALPGAYRATVLRVVDGDTIQARIAIWPGHEVTTFVRLRGIDAPETRARCAREAEDAETSRRALEALLSGGGMIVSGVRRDKYGGRIVADLADSVGRDVAATLLAAGHARPYRKGRRGGWCGIG